MSLPMFVEQVCKGHKVCDICRSKTDPSFRNAWASWYQVPPSWPECPEGVPWGAEPPPRPVESYLLGVLVDDPNSPEAKKVLDRLYQRADLVRPICQDCPEYVAIDENGLQVECKRAYAACCNSGLVQGHVHLGCGECALGKWGEIQPVASHGER